MVIFYKTYTKYGGQEKVIYNFSQILANKGYKVLIYIDHSGNPLDIAGKMELVIKNRTRLNSIALKAYDVVKQYPEEKVFEKYESVIQSV